MNRFERKWAVREKRGIMGYGKTRALMLLRLEGVKLEPDDAWDVAFRLHFPAAFELSDEELLLSLGTGPWKSPLPTDWPHGPLQRAWARIEGAANITDEAAALIDLTEEDEVIDLVEDSELIDAVETAMWQ